MSTRLFVEKCFDGKHADCKGYNGPADNPNFRCDCNCHKQPAEDERMKEIRQNVLNAVEEFCGRFDTLGERFAKQLRNAVRDGFDRPVQPAASTPTKCVKCGHNDTVNGYCAAFVPICSDDYHGTRFCGCKCVFTASTEAQGDMPDRQGAIDLLRRLRNTTDPDEIQDQKDRWTMLKNDLNLDRSSATTPPNFTEQAQRLVGDIKREAVGVFPLYSPGEELREIMVRGIVSLAIKADARGQVTGRQAFASELLGHLDRITSTTAGYHLVRNLCLIELGREPNSTGAAI